MAAIFAYEKPEFSSLSVEQTGDLQLTAQSMGIPVELVTQIIQMYGPAVLATVTEFVRHGFSVGVVIELLNVVGPPLLDFILYLINGGQSDVVQNTTPAPAGEGVAAQSIGDKFQANFGSVLLKLVVEKILPVIIEKYGKEALEKVLSPDIVNKYGDAFLKEVETFILQAISADKNAGQLLGSFQ